MPRTWEELIALMERTMEMDHDPVTKKATYRLCLRDAPYGAWSVLQAVLGSFTQYEGYSQVRGAATARARNVEGMKRHM